MNCRLCDCACENKDKQYKGLCRACGQKRESYAAAALAGLLSNGRMVIQKAGEEIEDALTSAAFKYAEKMVKIDRGE